MIQFIKKLFSKSLVVKKDSKTGYYFAYYKGIPVIGQGETREDAINCLNKDVEAIKEFDKSP